MTGIRRTCRDNACILNMRYSTEITVNWVTSWITRHDRHINYRRIASHVTWIEIFLSPLSNTPSYPVFYRTSILSFHLSFFSLNCLKLFFEFRDETNTLQLTFEFKYKFLSMYAKFFVSKLKCLILIHSQIWFIIDLTDDLSRKIFAKVNNKLVQRISW